MIKIAHICKNLMNIYGDNANIIVLEDRLLEQKVDYTIINIEKGESFNPCDFDFIFIAAGTEKSAQALVNWFKPMLQDFKKAIENNVIILCTDYYIFSDILDFKYTISDEIRTSRDVLVNNIIGYENTAIKYDTNSPLFKWQKFSIGYRYKNFFGTGLLGPILVKNPDFFIEILSLLIKDFDITLSDFTLENNAHSRALDNLKMNLC